jgi:hypothetical protein
MIHELICFFIFTLILIFHAFLSQPLRHF